ncbi:hypothetical protein VTL71DRAFT_3168 [Oculimacula yallundae]|uniref:Acetoacetate decarboxylase n=1 Tax=Oculimacula yallundae TaxID=86028 RepID=A0ABR4C8K8_9HELO
MPFGQLPVSGASIPQYAPPYPEGLNHFKLSCVAVEYRTTAAAAAALLPDFLEIDETPLCRSTIFTYHMSSVGAYNEYLHTIEVTWKGKKYDYVVILILDNESAIFAGREQWGFPKVWGNVELTTKTGSSQIVGSVERPKGLRFAHIGFTPRAKHTGPRPDIDARPSLTLRTIPSLSGASEPDIKELVSAHLDLSGGDLWVGKGSVAFPIASELHPFAKLPIVEYGNAFYMTNVDAVLLLDDSWKL